MHLTHGTLRGLTLHLPPRPAFAGRPAARHRADQPGTPRYGIGLGFEDAADRSHDVLVDVPAGGQASAHRELRAGHARPARRADAARRDALPARPVPRLDGLAPGHACSSDPRPSGRRAAAGAPAAAGEPTQRKPSESGEIEGVRAYRRGDPLKQVVWKKAARDRRAGQPRHQQRQQQELWLDWQLRSSPAPRSACRAWRPGPWRRSGRRRARPAPARRRDRAGQRRRPAAALPGGARPVVMSSTTASTPWLPRWPGWSHLPRDARDTLFLLAVIGWTLLPHFAPAAVVSHC